MKDIIEKEAHTNSKEIEVLKKYFPGCFDKEGSFNLEKFSNMISSDTNIIKDTYKMDWLGKSYSRLLVNTPVNTFLTEDIKHNSKEENINSNNLYIEGDNLEVLKHLSNAYNEKVKCIYIDPPYNTGSDGFIYQDDRKFSVEELATMANIDDDEAKKILDFTNSKSNSHSAWLTFMEPRLRLAYELLTEDGVIFISIDDNEEAQLKLLCDDIFGENNFVSNLIWKKKSGGTQGDFIIGDTEYIKVYAKSKSKLVMYYDKDGISSTSYNKMDDKGKYSLELLEKKSLGYIESLDFPIISPEGIEHKIIHDDENNKVARWRWSKETVSQRYDELVFVDGKVYTKNYEKNSYKPRNLLVDERFGRTRTGKTDLTELFNIKELFSSPKPVKLVQFLSSISTKENDIILDFFSGSGTTAQAVMELNAQDNGNRKYVCVQLPERCSTGSVAKKAGYSNICEVGKERIKRAATKIKEQTKADIDYGFKVFKTKELENSNYLEDLKVFDPTQLNIIPENSLTNEDLYNLATTWKTHDGIRLTNPFKLYSLNSYEALYVENKLYLMYQGFSTEELKRLLEINDSDEGNVINSVVIYAPNFTSKDIKELKEGISMVNKKNANIELEMRY